MNIRVATTYQVTFWSKIITTYQPNDKVHFKYVTEFNRNLRKIQIKMRRV